MSTTPKVKSRVKRLRTVPLDQIDDIEWGNPRAMSEPTRAALRATLTGIGLVDVPSVRRSRVSGRYSLVDGHHRIIELRALGETEVQVLELELTDDQARVAVLAKGKIHADFTPALDEWVRDWLLESPDARELLPATGFDPSELPAMSDSASDLLDAAAGASLDAPSEDVPAPPLAPAPAGPRTRDDLPFQLRLNPEQNEVIHRAIRAARERMGRGMVPTPMVLAEICQRYLNLED